ncbi:MAG: YIP1 family protein [Clostridia bacterium]|nr:YIP1 family protein [Clostridia bacterium]
MKKYLVLLMVFVLAAFMVVPTVSAAEANTVPYNTYAYWQKGEKREAVEIREVFEVVDKVSGYDLGIDAFSMPTDLDCDKDGNLYILDGDNSRIVVVDSQMKLLRVISSPVQNGEEVNFSGASGIYLKEDNTIYIADTNGQRIIVLNPDGSLKRIIGLPDATVIPDDFNYAPIKVLTDSRDYIYVLSSGSYYGALVYSDQGEFLGFYGANSVKSSVVDIFGKLWDRLTQTEAKRANSQQKLPYQFISMDIDKSGFIYTLTGLTDSIWDVGTGQIRRLNPAGINILKDSEGDGSDTMNFADESDYRNDMGHPIMTNFKKLCVDDDGFVYAVDTTYGHIFVYDNKCNSFAVFGGGFGSGMQDGTFTRPESVAVHGDMLYVLDSLDASVTSFKLTDYGKLYKQAQILTLDGKYNDSVALWEEVLKQDKNNLLAYRGLSKAALLNEDYEAAIEYSKIGFSQSDYAIAFEQLRGEFISKNIWWMLILGAALIGGVVWYIIKSKNAEKKLSTNGVVFALNSVIHPFDTFYRLKNKGEGSVVVAIGALLLFYISKVLCDIYSGFTFKIFEPAEYNSFETLLGSVGVAVLFVIVNWGVCVLAEGKGKLKEIFIVTCFALIPEILNSVLNLALTNMLIPEEAAILTVISVVCHILAAVVLCVGIMAIHEYDFFKFLITTILTVLGMLLVVFIIFMLFILFQQLFDFIGSIFTEIFYR